MMGIAKVLCVKQFKNFDDGNKGWAYAVARVVNRHDEAKEHKQRVNSYYEALGASRVGDLDLAVAATVLTTLSAYTIAKEGLPLSSQFPLLLFGLRGGAPVGTTHYEATSARRMIYNFAIHIEYELFKYLIGNDLPFSVLMDGSSSTRGTKWMAYMLRSLTPSFEPYTFHLLLAEVARETGESITEVLLSHFDERSAWLATPGLASPPRDFLMKRLISITTDGASTMVGRADGVYGRLQRHIRENTQTSFLPRTSLLLSVCAAHKLNLALKDVKHSGYTLGRALIMEMHAIFGATQSSSARRHYKDTAAAMAFKQLQMGQFFAIRWSDSFRHGLSNVLRMWPVLIESLNRIGTDRSISTNTRTRAKIASWVMRDARVFLMMKHVLKALDRVSSLSLFFQKTDCLAIDAMESARATVRSLKDDSLTNEVLEELTKSMSVLNLFDGYRRKLLSKQFLLNYYRVSAEDDVQSKRWRLGYLPRQFKDFEAKDTDDLKEEEERLRSELTSFKHFRSLEVSSDDEELFETVDFESDSLRFNRDNSPDIDFDVSLDFGLGYTYQCFLLSIVVFCHIILDIIEFSGNFQTEWEHHVPPGATFANRSRPEYFDENDHYNTWLRNDLISKSIPLLEEYCAVPKLKDPLLSSYSTLHSNVNSLREWPHDLRVDKTSKRLYKQLLISRRQLDMPVEVKLVLKCVLVIPSSNADSERTFSTANRLTAGERNSISTRTVSAVMHIQRNGPSLLTISPSKLVQQWLNPLNGLNLSPGFHSLQKSSTTMSIIKEALLNDKLHEADSLRKVIGTQVDVEALLNVFGEQALRGSLRGKADLENIRNDIIAVEKAKAEIFTIGELHESKK